MSETAIVVTPKKIDALILNYSKLQAEQDAADAVWTAAKVKVDAAKAELVELVERLGERHTAKSKKLVGVRHSATTTTGTLTTVDDAAVQTLKAYADSAEIPELPGLLFSARVSYQLVDYPDEVIGGLDMPTRIRTKLKSLVALCFKVKTKAPSLKVDVAETTAAA